MRHPYDARMEFAICWGRYKYMKIDVEEHRKVAVSDVLEEGSPDVPHFFVIINQRP